MEVVIPDKGLEKCLKQAIYQPSFITRTLTPKTLRSIRYLNANHRQIQDMTGIEYGVNLETLLLSYNDIKDLSFLHSLPKLKRLDLSGNQHLNWDTLSKPLEQIEELTLKNCRVRSDEILLMFPNVRVVSLFYNEINQIRALYHLSHLQFIDLSHNPLNQEELSIFLNLTGVGMIETTSKFEFQEGMKRDLIE